MKPTVLLLTLLTLAAPALGQSLNVDFGEPENGPPATYAAAGRPGVWNSLLASHGTTTENLLDLDGTPTAVSLNQFGGFDTPTVDDPATSGDDELLMDDYLITFDPDLRVLHLLRQPPARRIRGVDLRLDADRARDSELYQR